MPVLAVGGDIYPAVGGDLPGNFALYSTQQLAANVQGITVPLSGHWIPEEQPDFVVDILFKFFRSYYSIHTCIVISRQKDWFIVGARWYSHEFCCI